MSIPSSLRYLKTTVLLHVIRLYLCVVKINKVLTELLNTVVHLTLLKQSVYYYNYYNPLKLFVVTDICTV